VSLDQNDTITALAYNKANSANIVASSAYNKANTACTTADTAQSTGVAAFLKGNTAHSTANAAFTTANAAFTTANAAFTTANAALPSSSYTASDVLTKIKTVDGSGSGLDADLLDGQQGAYYRDASNLNAGTVPSARLSGSYTITASDATLATKASTLSSGGGNGTAMTFTYNGQGGQPTWLWGTNDGVNHYVFTPVNFSVNYATTAGNADTVDGYHGTAFVRAVSVVNPNSPSSGYQTLGSVSASIASGTLTITLNWVDIAEHPYVPPPPPPPPTPPPPPPMESAPPPPPMESAP